jgi:hypothetical protein
VGIWSWDKGHWGSLAGSNIYCANTDPADLYPKAESWEQRGLTLHILASRLQKQKAKLNPYMAACDFIGYFISPVLFDLFQVSVLLSFISLLCYSFSLLQYHIYCTYILYYVILESVDVIRVCMKYRNHASLIVSLCFSVYIFFKYFICIHLEPYKKIFP